jgi:acyl dehydratase
MGDTVIDVAGPWFEDFHVGLEFDAPAVTLTSGHAGFYLALTGDRLRLPLDHELARIVLGDGPPPVHPLLAISVAIGQTTWLSQRVKANLFYRGLALHWTVRIGDTLTTRSRVLALRQNRPQPGRAATGLVGLEVTTVNQRGERVMHCWRCPMIPCRDPNAVTGHADDLDGLGRDPLGAGAGDAALGTLLSSWRLERLVECWPQSLPPRATPIAAGQRYRIEARDTITMAPEFVRLTLNMAMAHTDARLAYTGQRLVYGGHVMAIAFAQVTRALPDLLTMTAWISCDHTAPAFEGDRVRTEVTVEQVEAVSHGLTHLTLRAIAFAARGEPETEIAVLDWRFRVLAR